MMPIGCPPPGNRSALSGFSVIEACSRTSDGCADCAEVDDRQASLTRDCLRLTITVVIAYAANLFLLVSVSAGWLWCRSM